MLQSGSSFYTSVDNRNRADRKLGIVIIVNVKNVMLDLYIAAPSRHRYYQFYLSSSRRT
jgi:hypothetical protein